MRVAVTGGTGFVGKALIRLLVERGYAVKALARNPDKFSPPKSVTIVAGDLQNHDALLELTDGCNVTFHLAGVTHARRRADYFAVNRDGAIAVAEVAAKSQSQLIHISSLSARQPSLSPYAHSKLQAEQAIAEIMPVGNWLALRLPAIYGPGDVATAPFFKLIKSGIAPRPKTNPPARVSLLHVNDAAAAIVAGMNVTPGLVYEVGDDSPDGHEWHEIADRLAAAMGAKVRHVAAPKPIVAAYYPLVRWFETAIGKTPSIREGQVNEFFHPDWVARDNLLSLATEWHPAITLEEGFAKTVIWYQENGLL